MTRHRLLAILAVMGLSLGAAWAGNKVEDWSGLSGKNTGSFADSVGSKLTYSAVEGPVKGEKALQVDVLSKEGGYCGLWHNLDVDLSKAKALKFMAKSDPPGTLSLSITDANKVQYVVSVPVPSKDWAEVSVPFSSFEQNKYYQPEGADKSKPLDLTKVSGLGLGPGAAGAVVFALGPLTYEEGAAPAAKAGAKGGKAVTLVLQDFATEVPDLSGWKDDKGSKIALSYKAAAKKANADDKMLIVDYDLTPGGWCGFFYQAGSSQGWEGVDFGGAKAMLVKMYTTKPVQFGISLEDADGVKFDGVSPVTTGGKWENLLIPMTDLPKELGVVKGFNLYTKTPGPCTLSIDEILLVK